MSINIVYGEHTTLDMLSQVKKLPSLPSWHGAVDHTIKQYTVQIKKIYDVHGLRTRDLFFNPGTIDYMIKLVYLFPNFFCNVILHTPCIFPGFGNKYLA